MSPVAIALWVVEAALDREITLAEIAARSGVSRFHLSRAFGAATGVSLIRYARGRRLTEAARRLAAGARDILGVALDAGYGSHEAFTRAFRDQFGLSPEALRARASLAGLPAMEIITMDQNLNVPVSAPRLEEAPLMLIAGIGERYRFETNTGIPAQWTYGVCCNADGAGSFEYIAGVEVSDFNRLPADLARIRLPARRYAVFTHSGHIAGLRATVYSIWNNALPASGLEVADAPDFERYDARFDPGTGHGDVDIFIPVKS
ncbi:MAG: AraC family transcriptional regulator [Alphaproteobacteria bacterium]|nr:AraC family transcriptional regulator [Alphaproteobacteria bacterium]